MNNRKFMRRILSGAYGSKFISRSELYACIDDVNSNVRLPIETMGRKLSPEDSWRVFVFLYRANVARKFWGWFDTPSPDQMIKEVA